MQVVVHSDPETLALATAMLVVDEARQAVARAGRFSLALSGGSTPKRAYELLASPACAGLVPWEHVHVFWADERCVDSADPLSNERMGREALLDHVPIPEGQVHPIRCRGASLSEHQVDGTQSVAVARRAADEYDAVLRAHFQAGTALDLVLLGLGRDGHTASLFAGSEVLDEKERWAAAVFVEGAAGAGTPDMDPGSWRNTLTLPFINRAARIVFVASGPSKAAIVQEVIEGTIASSPLPAQLVHPASGDLRWYLDADAAAMLTSLEGAR
jgi:6-phosphogluconolactonase